MEEEEESTIKLDHWTLEEKKPWEIDRCPFGPIVIKSTLLEFRRKKVYIFRPLCPLFFSSPFLCVCTFITTCNRHITARVIDPSVIIPSFFLLFFAFLRFFLLLSSLFSPPLAFSKVLGCRKKLEEGLIRQKKSVFPPLPLSPSCATIKGDSFFRDR